MTNTSPALFEAMAREKLHVEMSTRQTAKHTPGPWGIVHTNEVYANSQPVADCSNEYSSLPRSECEANARLIAAAPKLLGALEKISNETHIDMMRHIAVVAISEKEVR